LFSCPTLRKGMEDEKTRSSHSVGGVSHTIHFGH
jgi:hypothetical protein